MPPIPKHLHDQFMKHNGSLEREIFVIPTQYANLSNQFTPLPKIEIKHRHRRLLLIKGYGYYSWVACKLLFKGHLRIAIKLIKNIYAFSKSSAKVIINPTITYKFKN